MEKQVVIETRNVRKTFPGVVALDGINLRFKAGEVHAIIGENGAGKSTLMNILSGVYAPDSGSEVRYKGSRVEFRSTADAAKCQIAMIHQENSLVKHLTVYENIYLGHFIKKGAFIDKRAMRESAAELLKKMHIDWIKPGTLVNDLSASEQQLVEILRAAGHLESLQLLHFHLGSQMANIRDIATGVRESARFYVELHKLGVNIQCFDVGGGLGVDYEGTRSQSDCSVNYGLNEYANNIIWAIGDACEENGLPHPTVITESGRAVTAHHTVLVSNIIGVERNEYTEATPPAEDAARPLQSMWETWLEMHETGNRRSLREWLHDSQMDLHDIHIGYSSGTFNLQERAWAEQLYLNMCHEVQKQLDPSNRAHRPIIDELQERMADKIYVNFSLFQSMPDAWGIDQLFPVMPLEGLNKSPERRAVLLDITCDSDGAIDHYVDGDGIATTMPMPEYDPENPPMLGFFMVGAYQEILGNMHNLFGDTEAVDVFVFPDGSVEVELSDEGDTVADMLQYVQLDPNTLLTQFRDQVKNTGLDDALQQQFLEEFEAGLYGYTYLEDE